MKINQHSVINGNKAFYRFQRTSFFEKKRKKVSKSNVKIFNPGLDKNALSYLMNWTNNIEYFSYFSRMNLSIKLTWEDVKINESKIFNQRYNFNKFFAQNLMNSKFPTSLSIGKWVTYFNFSNNSESYSKLMTFCQYLISICPLTICFFFYC